MSIRCWSQEITFPPHCLNPPSNYQWNWVRRRRYQRQSGTLCGFCRLLTIWRIYVEFSLDRKTSPHLPLTQARYYQPQQFSNSYPPYFQNRPFPAGYTNSSCSLFLLVHYVQSLPSNFFTTVIHVLLTILFFHALLAFLFQNNFSSQSFMNYSSRLVFPHSGSQVIQFEKELQLRRP